MSENDQKRREDLYAETRKDLLTRQLSNSEKFDAAILTLSTAGLGVSLTFIKDIVPLGVSLPLFLVYRHSPYAASFCWASQMP